MRKIILAAAALGLLAPAAALARSAPEAKAWRVGADSYHLYLTGADLRTAGGRALALKEVERVAGKFCRHGVQADRQACVARIVRTSVSGPSQDALRLALEERAATRLAAAG